VLLYSIQCAKRCGTSLLQGETSRHLHFDDVFDVKLELIFEFPFYKITLERSAPRLVAIMAESCSSRNSPITLAQVLRTTCAVPRSPATSSV